MASTCLSQFAVSNTCHSQSWSQCNTRFECVTLKTLTIVLELKCTFSKTTIIWLFPLSITPSRDITPRVKCLDPFSRCRFFKKRKKKYDVQCSPISINLAFPLLKPIWEVSTFPHVTSIWEQPEEQLPHQSQTHSRHTDKIYGPTKCSPQKLQWSRFQIIYLIHFLRVASDHNGTAARLQMRADGPEPQRQRQTNQEQLTKLAGLQWLEIRLWVWHKTWSWAWNTGTVGSEPARVASALKSTNFSFPNHFIMFTVYLLADLNLVQGLGLR